MDTWLDGIIKKTLASEIMTKLLMNTIPKADLFLMKHSRGWINTAMQSLVLIETIGAKSTQKREIVTLCMPDGEQLLLVGSNWGRNRPPAWYFNLKAYPTVEVTFKGYRGLMNAREITGDQRDRLWSKLVAYNPQYAHYQQQCSRLLPIMQLSRMAE
ncbi:MAG: hypothetical protein CL692_06440 [Cellvibrionales bacterium]|nr:hypothetical protein [Cellvibrionales bacterium]